MNSGLIDKEETNFLHRIFVKCTDFEDEMKIFNRKKAGLERALERLKKAHEDVYSYKCDYSDSVISVRDTISNLSVTIAQYEDYMSSSEHR